MKEKGEVITEENKKHTKQQTRHSRLAVASTILPICIWIYMAVLCSLFLRSAPFQKFLKLFFDGSLGAAGAFLLLVAFLLIAVPVAGHFTGTVFGLISFFDQSSRRIFAVTGLILNILPFALALILIITVIVIYKTGYIFAT